MRKPVGAHGHGSVVVAVARASGDLEFYRIGPSHQAERLRSFAPPRGGTQVASVSLTAGAKPNACALWIEQSRASGWNVFPSWREVICYSLTGTGGQYTLTGFPKQPDYLALSHDGRALAWEAIPTGRGYTNDLYFAKLRGRSLTDITRVPPGDHGCCVHAMGLAWAGQDRLVIDIEGQSDEGSAAAVMPLSRASIRRGWRRAVAVFFDPPARDFKAGYDHIDGVVSASRQTALAIERPGFVAAQRKPPGSRAVQLTLSTGRISAVIASADTGRSVVSVSGRPRAFVYQTQDAARMTAARYYLRLAGQSVGTLITGLPEDALSVTAQT
jgi:hypothetical protein